MSEKPTVSIVLGAYNRLEFLKVVIQNTRQEVKNIPHEIIVVDGGSTDGSLEWLITQKDIVTIVQHNRGDWDGKTIMRRSWGYFMNLAFKSAKAPHILMISDDTVFHTGAIENALQFIETQKQLGKRIGAVPFFFHDVNLEPENQYKVGVLLGNRFLSHGIYMRDAFAEVGFADEDNFMFYGADIDICFKLIHAGYEIIPCPTAFMLHCPYHPLRHTIENRDAIWLEGTTALIKKWEGIFAPASMKPEDVPLEFEWLTYKDTSELEKIFDEALENQANADGIIKPEQHDLAVRMSQLENRLTNMNSSIRYHINMTETFQNRFYHEWMQFLTQMNAPLYKRVLSKWKIFYPLRWLRNKVMARKT